jgi:hypothetical protein
MKTWLLSAAAALSLAGGAWAQEAPAEAPETVAVELPVQPDAETVAVEVETPEPPSPYGECIPSLIPAGARCRVVGTQTLGEVAGGQGSWALYSIRGAKGRSGLSVLMNPQLVSTMPVSNDAVESWVANPYPMAGVVKKGDAEYVVVSVQGDEGPEANSVHRVDASGWTPISADGLKTEVGSRLKTLTGAGCQVVAGGMNWRTFALRYDLIGDEGSCGAAFLTLGVENGALRVTEAMAVKPNVTPPRRRARRR